MRVAVSFLLHHSFCKRQATHVNFVCASSRSYSTVLLPSHNRTVKVQVPIGASGHVELDTVEPLYPSSTLPRSILAYLPPGPFFPSSNAQVPPAPKHDSTIPLLLASILPNTTIITINYRLSRLPSPPQHHHTFPLPIFDTLRAFDYITSPHSPHNKNNNGHHDAPPRLSLYGTHIGGALATALALTEPTAIHALAVSEPVVDWVSLDENAPNDNGNAPNDNGNEGKNPALKPATKRKPKFRPSGSAAAAAAAAAASPLDPMRLLRVRTALFRGPPETYFDAFASPILFLRAPGRDCPSNNQISDPLLNSYSSSPQRQAYGPYDDDVESHSHSPSTSSLSYQPPKRRKVLRRWPPNTAGAILPPYTHVYVRASSGGEAGVLRAQGEELVELMRRACFYGREKGVGETRVQLEKMADTADSGVEGIIGIREAAMWLRERFEEN